MKVAGTCCAQFIHGFVVDEWETTNPSGPNRKQKTWNSRAKKRHSEGSPTNISETKNSSCFSITCNTGAVFVPSELFGAQLRLRAARLWSNHSPYHAPNVALEPSESSSGRTPLYSLLRSSQSSPKRSPVTTNQMRRAHSRRATRDVIAILDGIKSQVVLHWFSGSKKELERAIGCGFFFSVNSAMLLSENGRNLILRMPRERVLTETDGPFVQDGRSPATPNTVKATVRVLADLWGLSPDEVQIATLDNFRELLKTQ